MSGDRREPEKDERDRGAGPLQSITGSSLGFMSLDEMLAEVLERIRDAMDADTVAVLLLDEDRGVLVARAARGLEEEVRQGVQVPFARGFAGRVAARAEPIIIDDLSRFDVVNPLLRQKGIRSMLGVPVLVEGRVIGVLHVGSLDSRSFEDEDIALLQLAADRVALALDNARLAEQRAVTEIMQRTLLPAALPTVPGLRLSGKYLPAGSAVRIGGDWYDVFELADGRVTFVIGDVVGRGVLAASVMAEIRTALQAYLVEGHRLTDAMALLNDLLVSMGRNRSATAAIVELDLDAGALELVSAAHLPPVLLGPDAAEGRLLQAPQGPLLGIKPAVTYRSERFPFPPGSTLLLYTDGIVERRGEPLNEGIDRLLAATRMAADPNDGSFADRVYGALLGPTSLEDDVALLAIESIPFGPALEITLSAEAVVLAGLRRTIGRWLANHGVGADDRFDLALATSEAAANAIEHAYGAREATFAVAAERSGSEVVIVVGDRGRWRTSRPYGRGRGLSLMRALVDEVEVERSDEGTTVTLVKRLSGEPT